MKKKHKIDAALNIKDELISESKPTFIEPEVDISICSKPLTKEEEKEISEFIAKRKKELQQERKITST